MNSAKASAHAKTSDKIEVMQNGHEPSRLQLMTRALDEATVRSQAHSLETRSNWKRDYPSLHRAQVLFAEEMRQLSAAQKKTEAALASLAVRCDETTDKLNALIDLVDRHLRGN